MEVKATADNITNGNVIGLLLKLKKKKKSEYLIEGLSGVMTFTANGLNSGHFTPMIAIKQKIIRFIFFFRDKRLKLVNFAPNHCLSRHGDWVCVMN